MIVRHVTLAATLALEMTNFTVFLEITHSTIFMKEELLAQSNVETDGFLVTTNVMMATQSATTDVPRTVSSKQDLHACMAIPLLQRTATKFEAMADGLTISEMTEILLMAMDETARAMWRPVTLALVVVVT